MVTTIKITCDGVFIQSNSYNNYNETRTQAAINTEISSSSSTTNQSSSTPTTTANKTVKTFTEKDKSTVNSKCKSSAVAATTTTTRTEIPELSVCRTTRSRSNSSCNSNNNCIVDNGISCQIRSDCRKRYYFGSNGSNNNNDIYWCKNTHNRTRSSPKELTSEYIARCNNKKDFVHICDKFRATTTAAAPVATRNFVTTKSIVLSKSPTNTVRSATAATPIPLPLSFFGNNLKSNLINTQIQHRSKFHTDSSLLSFLRDISARHFSRTEIELKDNTDNSIMLKLRSSLLTTIIDRFPTIIAPTTTTATTNTITTTTTTAAAAAIASRNSIDSQSNKSVPAKICNDWFG